MQNQAEEEELGLSYEALTALKEFALENNLLPAHEAVDADVRLQVQERLDVKEKDHDFRFTYGGDGDAIDEQVSVVLTGVNPELGQTLASTGLTVWRAAEELARFMWEHRCWFVGKNLVELGAGLGLCSVLASRLCIGGNVVVTDGGDEFTDSAMDGLRRNLEKNSCHLEVPPGRHLEPEDGSLPADGTSTRGDPSICDGGARVVLERLTWGEHEDFLQRYGEGVEDASDVGRRRGGFDFIVAADVLYEEEAVIPLLRTVVDILRLLHDARSHRRKYPQVDVGSKQEQDTQPDQRSSVPFRAPGDDGGGDDLVEEVVTDGAQTGGSIGDVLPPRPCSAAGLPWSISVPTFLLAFARRNVSIDRVLREAEGLGLRWAVPDDFVPSSASENVYVMCLDDGDKGL